MEKVVYPIWCLRTYGGGPPTYIIIAPDQKTAWNLAIEKFYTRYKDSLSNQGNTIDDVKPTGMYADLSMSDTNIFEIG